MVSKANILLPCSLGDIVMAIPIAGFYHDSGLSVTWPISKSYYSTVSAAAPWINWVPVDLKAAFPEETFDQLFARFGLPQFYNDPDALTLLIFHIDYQASEIDMHLKFDQYRYCQAQVPFLYKWRLAEYVTRYPDQEAAIKAQVVKSDRYVVTHTKGSTISMTLNSEELEAQGFQVIEIDPTLTDNAFNWLGVLEGASHLYLFDSCFANIVDQMQLTVPKTFYRRSLWANTPVMAMNWSFGPAPQDIVEQIEADNLKNNRDPKESAEFSELYRNTQRGRLNFMRKTMHYRV